jgi:hypothetical protein
LAYASWPIALAHTFGLGTDAGEQWVMILGAVCVMAVGISLVWRLRTEVRRREVAPPLPSQQAPLTRRVTTSSGGRRDVR